MEADLHAIVSTEQWSVSACQRPVRCANRVLCACTRDRVLIGLPDSFGATPLRCPLPGTFLSA